MSLLLALQSNDLSLIAGSGSYTITGEAWLYKDRVLVANGSSFDISGSANFLYSQIYNAGSGSFTLTVTDSTITKQSALVVDSLAMTAGFNDADLSRTLLLQCDTGRIVSYETTAVVKKTKPIRAHMVVKKKYWKEDV